MLLAISLADINTNLGSVIFQTNQYQEAKAMSHFALQYSSFCFVLQWVWFSNIVELLLNHNHVHWLLK